MFNIDAKKRKAIYNIFAVMNAVVAALVPVAVQFQFIPVEWSENIIQAGAGVLSFVGFVLASRNVSVPTKTVDESLGYTPEGAVVIEA